MKKLLNLCLVVLIGLAIVGCQNQQKQSDEPEGPITVTFWHTLTDQHLEALNKVIDGFNAEHEGEIVVVAEQKPYADYDSNLMMAVANGNGPDFVSMYQTNAADYLADDLLADMTAYVVEAYGSVDAWKDSLISEDVYTEATQFGILNSFPVSSSSQVLFYNKDMFDALGLSVPTTWEELADCAAKIHEAYPDVIPFTMDDELDDFQGIMTQKGYQYIDMDKKEVVWPKDATVELLQWYVDNCDAGNFKLKELGTYCSNDYATGITGMYTGSSAGASYACWGNSWDGVAPIPQVGTKKYIANWGGGYVIFKSTEEKERACFEFLKYFASPEINAEWARGFNTIPSYKASYDTDTFKEYAATDIAAKAMQQQSECMGSLAACIGSVTVRDEIQKMIRTAVNHEVTVEEAVDTFFANANAALKD